MFFFSLSGAAIIKSGPGLCRSSLGCIDLWVLTLSDLRYLHVSRLPPLKFEGCVMNLFFLSHRGDSHSHGRVVCEAAWLGFHHGTLSGGKEKKEWNSGDKIRQRVSGRKAQECFYPFMPHTVLLRFPSFLLSSDSEYLVSTLFGGC